MCILPDHKIVQYFNNDKIDISPFKLEQVEPASYDFRLGDTIEIFKEQPEDGKVVVNPNTSGKNYETIEKDISNGIEIPPDEFFLGTTKEYIKLPDNLAADVKGRSSFGRIGIDIHRAGWVDPGFEGQITLELHNASPNYHYLEEGMRVGQFVFKTLLNRSKDPYDGDYQGQRGVTDSKFNK
jgi:dCTP deaminase